MFSATVGGRYTEDKKDAFPDQYDLATPNVKQVPAAVVQRHLQFLHTLGVGVVQVERQMP